MDVKLPKITKAKLVLTEACQLNCTYCYESHGTKRMSFETAKSVIDMLLENSKDSNSIPEIDFFGGEPLLVYEELMKPCIEYIRGTLKCRYNIGFTTNGLLLDEEKLKYLRSMSVKFMLSIDGCKVAHDTHRVYKDGAGSFEEIEKKLSLILKYFPNTMARMTVTPENVQYLYDSVRYIAEAGFHDMHVIPNLHISIGKEWSEEDYIVLKEQLSMIVRYIVETFEKEEIPLVFRTLQDMFARIVLANYSRRVDHHRLASCCSPMRRCGIGSMSNVIIDTEGNIFSCQHGSPEPTDSNVLYIGNMDTGVLDERRLNLISMNQDELHSSSLDCEKCPLNPICTGGCVPNNYAITGKFTEVPESYCRWTQALYEAAEAIIEEFDKDQSNLLFKDYFYGIVKRGVICVC